jgi:hypothetical protein
MLLLSIATAAMWLRSQWYCDSIDISANDGVSKCLAFGIADGGNQLHLQFENQSLIEPIASSRRWKFDRPMFDTVGPFLGFGHAQPFVGLSGYGFQIGKDPENFATTYILTVPFWFAVMATMALPVIWGGKRLRAKAKMPAGHCSKCGYDLRATPERCPECGMVPSKKSDCVGRPSARHARH